MLIHRKDHIGKLWDTKNKKWVNDPNYVSREDNSLNVQGKSLSGQDIEDLFGIKGRHHFVSHPDIRFLVTEDEWELATDDSKSSLKRGYEMVLSTLAGGDALKDSILFSLSHKARTLDLCYALLVNAYLGGQSVEKLVSLEEVSRYDLSQYTKDMMVVRVPYLPTSNQLSALVTLLEFRDQRDLATILVDTKYDVNSYRILFNTDITSLDDISKVHRKDLVLLISLEQERSVSKLERFASGVGYDFAKVKDLETSASKPNNANNTDIQRSYNKELRKTFVDISRQKATNVSNKLFGIDPDSLHKN